MTQQTKPRTERMHAAERREEILQAAMTEFAVGGLHGTSTEKIAQRAGVSQPYLFRLFGTKKELFLAAVEGGFDRVEEVFRLASEGKMGEEALDSIGLAYARLLQNRDLLLLQMHSYAACSDPEIRDVVRERYSQLVSLSRAISGAPNDRIGEFFAHGMLLNVVAAMDLVPLAGLEEWITCLVDFDALFQG